MPKLARTLIPAAPLDIFKCQCCACRWHATVYDRDWFVWFGELRCQLALTEFPSGTLPPTTTIYYGELPEAIGGAYKVTSAIYCGGGTLQPETGYLHHSVSLSGGTWPQVPLSEGGTIENGSNFGTYAPLWWDPFGKWGTLDMVEPIDEGGVGPASVRITDWIPTP